MRNEVFDFLDKVRDAGTVNMFDAARLLEGQFGFTPEEAKMNFFQWTQHLQRDEEAQNEKNTEAQVNSTWSTQENSEGS